MVLSSLDVFHVRRLDFRYLAPKYCSSSPWQCQARSNLGSLYILNCILAANKSNWLISNCDLDKGVVLRLVDMVS